jgi:hypothetical protein
MLDRIRRYRARRAERRELRAAIIETARAIIATDGRRAPFCEADAFDLAYYIIDARTGRPMI